MTMATSLGDVVGGAYSLKCTEIPPTWTSRTALRWPARSCRSCHSSCTSLCRGTQWRERCGTPPNRSLGRPEPDQNPLHLHWCAEEEIDYRGKKHSFKNTLNVVVKSCCKDLLCVYYHHEGKSDPQSFPIGRARWDLDGLTVDCNHHCWSFTYGTPTQAKQTHMM